MLQKSEVKDKPHLAQALIIDNHYQTQDPNNFAVYLNSLAMSSFRSRCFCIYRIARSGQVYFYNLVLGFCYFR